MKSIVKWFKEEFEVIKISYDIVKLKNLETGEIKEFSLIFFLRTFDLEKLSKGHKKILKDRIIDWNLEKESHERQMEKINESIIDLRSDMNYRESRFWTLKNMIATVKNLDNGE